MVACEDTAPAEKVEEGGLVEDKAEYKPEVKEGQLQDGVAEGAEDGEALLEEAEEDEEGDEEDEDEEDEDDEEDPEDPKEVMQELDVDKDGLLDLAELTNQDSQEEMDENSREQNGLKIKEVFEMFDKNKDGKLDMQELSAALEEMDKRDL